MSQLFLDQYFKSNKKRSGLNESTPPPSKLLKLDENPSTSKFEESETSSELLLKKKILESVKKQELIASLQKLQKLKGFLKAAEQKTEKVNHQLAVGLKSGPESFPKSQVLEKPQKKPVLTPVKSALNKPAPSNVKSGLRLPFKYRTVYEIFHAVDVVVQIMYNRKEMITLKKIKPAVEEMCKKTFTEKHLAQICAIYPEAFDFSQGKIVEFGSGTRHQEWQLLLSPKIENGGDMTAEVLLGRRKNLYNKLTRLAQKHHNDFLVTLTPPMIINKDKILHWHPEFELEKIPDVEQAPLPEKPQEETFKSGKEMLEKAREMFGHNSRVEKALAKLAEDKSSVAAPKTIAYSPPNLKGIPKSLLEKVRQRQAAKALLAMTKSADKENVFQIYLRLPEIARLVRNLFVTERKNVLQLDVVVEKLQNSYRSFLSRNEAENHLRMISEEIPEWLIFNNVRELTYLKLNKDSNLNDIVKKLQSKSKEMSGDY